MADVLPQLLLVFVLVVLNAAFSGTEMALVTLREGQLARLEQASSTGALLARLARRPNQFLATIQVGITLAGFLASAAAAVSLSAPLEDQLGFLGGAAGPGSVVVVTLALSYLTLVFGELAPKRIAMQRAERWGLVMARPLSLLTTITRPVVWLLSHSTNLAVRLAGADPNKQREEVTEDDLRDMVAVQPSFTADQRQIIDGAFEIAERTLDQVLMPRSDVFVVDADWSCSEALAQLADSHHTRAPVATGRNLDDVIGFVHLRQLLAGGPDKVSTISSELPVFPEAARALTTLRDLQIKRAQMALVINEHGGAEGIVTVEDLVEELVGEIYDETDPDHAGIRHEPDGTTVLPGRFPVHELPDIGIEVPEGDYATIAGFVLSSLGRIPSVGDDLTTDGWHIQVRGLHRHSITEVAITAVPSEPEEDDEAAADVEGVS